MRLLKSLAIVALLSVFSVLRGQSGETILDTVDFNDLSLIGTETLDTAIASYIDSAQDKTKPAKDQMYDMILAADNVLAHASSSFEMYRYVYQFMISGFSAMGANMVVDYMVHLPYFEFVEADDIQAEEMNELAESYKRVRIGADMPEIQTQTLDGKEFNLSRVEAENVVLLFWSNTCPNCHEMIKQLAELTAKRDDLVVVTVCVSKDLKSVRKYLKKSHLKGYHICDGEGWNSPVVDAYAVDMTPSLFLLKDKKIFAKPIDIEELVTILER